MNLDELQNKLGYQFRDAALLKEAITHSSVRYSGKAAAGDEEHSHRTVFENQRLEFFGDAVLQLISSTYLFEQFPNADEGRLTKMRSRLTSRSTFARLARRFSLGEFLALGKGEEASGGRHRASNLADAYEAIVGAIYLDGGLDAATKFALAQWQPELTEHETEIENPKGLLQETLQARSTAGPTYKIVRVEGPDHAREFEAVAEFEGRELGRGIGCSKKEAETKAAAAALEKLNE